MKKTPMLLLAGMAMGIFAACCTAKQTGSKDTNIAYQVADNYFFNNDADVPASPIVTTRSEFDRLYGSAAVMGKNGQPTEIDFDRRFVIGITLPLTNDHTEIIPGSLTSDGKQLTLHYKVKVGERAMSWTMRPMVLLVVDRKHLQDTCVLQQD